MDASMAFNMAVCGSLTEAEALNYDRAKQAYYDQFEGATGWLAETIAEVREEHNTFMRSRMWEFGNIINSQTGYYVSPYQLGYLGYLNSQRSAEGHMCDIILANPDVGSLWHDERIEGYEGHDHHRLNTGVGEDNYFYRKVTDGMFSTAWLTPVEKEGDTGDIDDAPTVFRHAAALRAYLTSRDKFTRYTSRERADCLKTWRASSEYVKHGFDPTSQVRKSVYSVEEVKKLKEKVDAASQDLDENLSQTYSTFND